MGDSEEKVLDAFCKAGMWLAALLVMAMYYGLICFGFFLRAGKYNSEQVRLLCRRLYLFGRCYIARQNNQSRKGVVMAMIEKIKGWKFKSGKEKLQNCLTESFRELAQKELGELDTATSFMYLYNRFGKPNIDRRAEYKILYEYRFLYKDLFVSIHAGGYNHVIFGLLVRKPVIDPVWEEYIDRLANIGKRLLEQGIIYFPYIFPRQRFPSKYKEFNRENDKAFRKAWKEYWETKTEAERLEYIGLCELREKSEDETERYKLLKKICDKKNIFYSGLAKKFSAALSEEEREKFYGRWSIFDLSNFPEIEKQCKEFLSGLKTASWIRDVPINIRGYESETNKIIYPEGENE